MGLFDKILNKSKSEPVKKYPVDGGKTEGYLEGLKDDIEISDITSFSFVKEGELILSLKIEDGKAKIRASHESVFNNDDSEFFLEYESVDLTGLAELLKELCIREKLSVDNGHYISVAGLPPCGGETLDVRFSNGERIYRSSNQGRMVSEKASGMIYSMFRMDAVRNGYDFTAEKSMIKRDLMGSDNIQG